MKIVYMGTPEFAVIPLVEISKIHDVALAVTQVDKRQGRGKKLNSPPVKIAAEKLNIPVYQTEDINSEESVELLKSVGADIFVVAAFGQILKEEVLNIPRFYPINIHASILPAYRGASPINRAIIEGERVTGVSVMKMGPGLDDGDVALVKEYEIGEENAEELTMSLSKLGAEAIVEFLNLHERGNVEFYPQDHTKSTYAGKIDKSMGEIDFSQPGEKIVNLVRGLYPKPGAHTVLDGVNLKVYDAHILQCDEAVAPGTVVGSRDSLVVKTCDGAISIDELQLPGKKRMDAGSFLRGNSIPEGTILGG